MKVTIDSNLCTGHGRCYATAPEVFEPDERGLGVVITPDVPADLESTARTGAANCPEGAIRIED